VIAPEREDPAQLDLIETGENHEFRRFPKAASTDPSCVGMTSKKRLLYLRLS